VFDSSFAALENWIAETMAEETAVTPITVERPLTIEEEATSTEDQIPVLPVPVLLLPLLLSVPLLPAEKEESLMNIPSLLLPPAAVATAAFESTLSSKELIKNEPISDDGSEYSTG
jgi:hypothetical protein